MRISRMWRVFLPVLFSAAPLPAAGQQVTPAELLEEVGARVAAVVPAPRGLEWPPEFSLVERTSQGDTMNVLAGLDQSRERCRVSVTNGIMDHVVRGSPDGLAFIIGHELAHFSLGHFVRGGRTEYLILALDRRKEMDADSVGACYAMQAGYSYRAAMRALRQFVVGGWDYAPFEGIKYDHPSWSHRLEQLDRERAGLWRSMSSFFNGTLFLQLEQYATAEECFLHVTREFPDCAEAWSNLGYVRLMQYLDNLSPEDVRKLGVGHLAAGGFYRRPGSLLARAERGTGRRMWEQAVAALTKALEVQPDLTLARANLGVCYLTHPSGKAHATQARRLLGDAAARAGKDPRLDLSARISVMINAELAALAAGEGKEHAGVLDSLQGVVEKSGAAGWLAAPLLFNRAFLAAASPRREEKQRAVLLFEQFLGGSNRSSVWWEVGYGLYDELCRQTGAASREKKSLGRTRPRTVRTVVSVALDDTKELVVSEPMEEARRKLGRTAAVVVVPGKRLVECRYPDHGLCILGEDRILAIRLQDANAPHIPLRGTGLGQPVLGDLYVGMSSRELDALLPRDFYFRAELVESGTYYRFHEEAGLALREEGGTLREIVVTMVPREPKED
ncbi:MAG: M48 family metalloprotease [Bacteroidota bacterium]